MSKIAKALEKSQQVRAESSGRSQQAPQGDQADVNNPQCPELGSDYPGLKELSYTRSKVVRTDPELLERNRILGYLNNPETRDHFNILRTQVLQRTREKCWNTIMVTSPTPGEGKTLTSIQLAMSIAHEVQQTALVVDTNLRNPKVAEYLGLQPKLGLPDYLMGKATVEELFINPDVEKLLVLPGGKPIHGATELLGAPRMQNLVKEMKTRYPERYVIFDCPHLLNMPDSQVFTEYVDAILLVVRADTTRRQDIQAAAKLLKGRNLLGTVYNVA